MRNEHERFLGNRQPQKIEFNEENIDNRQFEERLQIETDKLDVETKTLFKLRFMEEMSIKEIAEIMECPEGTIKSRLFYLSKHLSKKLSVFKPE